MESIQDCRQFLSEQLVKRTKKNRNYSQRAFANLLNLSAGELSEILNGKRKLSIKKALLIAEKLSLDPQETLSFLQMTKKPQDIKNSSNSKDINSTQLSLDTFEIISNWYCFAIISLSECVGFSWEKEYISRKLDISLAETRDALLRLEKVGLIKSHDTGDLCVNSDFVMSPNQISSVAIRKSHHELLHKAITALEEKPIEERNITGIGMALSEDEYQSMTKDIAQFRRDLVKKYGYSSKEKNKVYQLEIALFELTQGNTND